MHDFACAEGFLWFSDSNSTVVKTDPDLFRWELLAFVQECRYKLTPRIKEDQLPVTRLQAPPSDCRRGLLSLWKTVQMQITFGVNFGGLLLFAGGFQLFHQSRLKPSDSSVLQSAFHTPDIGPHHSCLSVDTAHEILILVLFENKCVYA